MIALSCKDIKKEYGTDLIIDKISFSINQGDKVALIGANGVGKSTLFKILTGELEKDGGEYYVDRNSTLGYMSQKLSLDSEEDVYNEVLKVFSPLLNMEEKLRRLEEEMKIPWSEDRAKWHENLLKEYNTLTDLYIARGGQTFRGEIMRVLTGLGIGEDYFNKRVNVLSGGEKSRIALAKLLLLNPDIILMDEPTNHLDLDAVQWLEEYLKAYRGTLLIISHDRFFLNEVTNMTFLMHKNEVFTYNAPYSKYLDLHKKNMEDKQKAYEIQREEIKRQEEIIETLRRFNREKSIKRAESRQKLLDKIVRLEAPSKEGKAAKIKFKAAFQSGNDVIIAKKLSKSYGERRLFHNVNLHLKRGNKIAIIGENGRGKTTLFNILRGKIKADEGFVEIGRNVQIGYYDQEQKDLNDESTVMDEIWDDFPSMTTSEVRTSLGAFLFRGDDVFKTVDLLSGGEKCRINLLKLMLREDNLLLLDEPTNHLDIPSREALEESLMDYDGTMVVISHDRYFLNKVIDRIYELKEDKLEEYLGNYSYYLEKKVEVKKEKVVALNEGSPSQLERKKRKEDAKTYRKREARIRELEKEIEKIDEKITGLNELLSDPNSFQDYNRTNEIMEDLSKSNEELQVLMEEWEELLALNEDN